MKKKIEVESNLGKGFTLIELLAVIVILALLVLVAMPAVTRIIDSSTKNSFKNEILGVAKNMETAYTDKWGKGETESDNTKVDTKIHTISITEGETTKSYSYLCMTLANLNSEQYQKKNLGDKYGGYLQMFVGDGVSITVINTTNGSYYMQGRSSALEAGEPQKAVNSYGAVSSTTTCPAASTITAIPA